MGIVKRSESKSCKSSRYSHTKPGGETGDERLFTLESLGAPEKVHLPVNVIERRKFSKSAESSMKKYSADEILFKKREDLKKSLKDFIRVAFPSSKSPYKYLMSSPGSISDLEKFYIANKRELKPPKYRVYFDSNLYYFSLNFNDNVEYSDGMPSKVLAKLQVAHKALVRIRRQKKEKAAREKAEKEKIEKIELAEKGKATGEMTEETMLIGVNKIKDQLPKESYQLPRVRGLWANKKREPKDDNWFMKNVSRRNFALFKGFYPNTDESESTSKKRKSIDWNNKEIFQGAETHSKKIRLEQRSNENFRINKCLS